MSEQPDIPSDNSTITDLQVQLDKWGVDHFGAHELVQLDNPHWRGPREPVPPEKLWPHIRDTVQLADEIRERWGDPIIVSSGWRPLAYNRLIGSQDTSAHIPFRALDLQPVGRFSLAEYFPTVVDVIDDAHDSGLHVGLGLYYDGHGRFVHVDTGHASYNRDWARGGPEYDPDAPSNPFVERYEQPGDCTDE